ncbi:unnamed protein product [Lathyrus sativus]|nr:unnamed protein product [Lathyrus sativus]
MPLFEKKRSIMFLPHELIIEILLRLPVKSLLRFKCVCNLWSSLISRDSHFANSHFQLSATTSNPKILLISTSTHEFRSIDLETSLSDDSASVSFNLPDYFTDFKIKGSCRGFILFCGSFNIYVWNPSTGLHKQIPFSPFGSDLDEADYFYGFGYDHSTNDYLVVSMCHPLHLEYFSLKSNTWKEVEAPHFSYADMNIYRNQPKGGSLYNGAIHWLASCYDLPAEFNQVIATFNLMERKLSYIHLPQDSDGNRLQLGGLWVYGEFLSIYTKNYRNDTVEIWVMKEYNVDSSWTRILVLPIDLIICPNSVFFPLCCTKRGEIIVVDEDDGLVKYDKSGEFLDLRSYPHYDLRCKVTIYMGSLLSLPGDDDNKQY